MDVVEGGVCVDRGGAGAVVAAVDGESEGGRRSFEDSAGVHGAVLRALAVVEAEEVFGACGNLNVAVGGAWWDGDLRGHEVHLAGGDSGDVLGEGRVVGASETHPIIRYER